MTPHGAGLRAMLLMLAACGGATPRPTAANETPTVVSPEESFRLTPPPFGPVETFKPPAVHEATLSNGIRVLLQTQRGPLATVRLVFLAAPGANDQELATRNALLAELLNAIRDPDTLARWDAARAVVDWRRSYDALQLLMTAPPDRVEEVVDLLLRALVNPPLTAQGIAHQAGYLESAQLASEADPRQLANRTLSSALFGANHPYAAPDGGSSGALHAVTLSGAQAIFDKMLNPRTIAIVAAGDLSAETFVPLLERRFGDLKARPNALPEPPTTPALSSAARRKVIVIPSSSATVHVRVGWVVPELDREEFAAVLVSAQALRTRLIPKLQHDAAVAEAVWLPVSVGRGGWWSYLATAVDPTRLTTALEIISGTLRDLPGLPESEVAEAKDNLLLSEPFDYQRSLDMTHTLALRLMAPSANVEAWTGARIQQVGAATFRRIAKRVYDIDRATIVLSGDEATIASSLRSLGWQAP